MIVIALTGLMRAGKDSVADILVRDHGFVKMAFAAPLKRMVKNLNPIVGTEFVVCGDPACFTVCGNDFAPVYLQDLYDRGWTDEDIKASEYGDEARRLWQRFGTDVMRAEQDDYWIQKAKADLLASGHDRVVFTDCRFPNEADMVYRLNEVVVGDDYESADYIQSSVWKVTRPGVEPQPGAHASEQWVGRMGEEIQIANDGTLEELKEPVDIAVQYVAGEKTINYGGWVHLGFTTESGLIMGGK